MEGDNGVSGSLMPFGENNNNLFCPMIPNPNSDSSLFLLPPFPNHHQDRNGAVSMVLDNNYFHGDPSASCTVKSKIVAHPYYHRLLTAYVNCQKIGAPPEVVAKLEATMAATGSHVACTSRVGDDPALDQFMEAYCEMLIKYEQELSKPYEEAMVFLSRIECQLKSLNLSNIDSAMEVQNITIDPQAEDEQLKVQLLQKYSGYLGSLKQEFMKKRKKGKLPKEARQQLLDWWTRHYKWPYPSESQKVTLAESTGLDPKQINNWFINQRKRHWKPSEDMQFVVMDTADPHYYLDNVALFPNPFPINISPHLL